MNSDIAIYISIDYETKYLFFFTSPHCLQVKIPTSATVKLPLPLLALPQPSLLPSPLMFAIFILHKVVQSTPSAAEAALMDNLIPNT